MGQGFELRIETDNAAFDKKRGLEAEVVRILREVAGMVESGMTAGGIRDLNGDTVGRFGWRYVEEPEG